MPPEEQSNLAHISDENLVNLAGRASAGGLPDYGAELLRRTLIATRELTKALTDLKASTDKIGKVGIALTVVLVVLTVGLLFEGALTLAGKH